MWTLAPPNYYVFPTICPRFRLGRTLGWGNGAYHVPGYYDSIFTVVFSLGKEYVCVLRLHGAIESELVLAKVDKRSILNDKCVNRSFFLCVCVV